jgi:hypothetical protein
MGMEEGNCVLVYAMTKDYFMKAFRQNIYLNDHGSLKLTTAGSLFAAPSSFLWEEDGLSWN